MNTVFPDANISGYESLIDSVELPDQKDRHVVTAAIQSKANIIVTANIRDFPKEILLNFGLEAQHPDFFVVVLLDLYPEKSLDAFRQQVSNLRKPTMTPTQVLKILHKVGLPNSAISFKSYCKYARHHRRIPKKTD